MTLAPLAPLGSEPRRHTKLFFILLNFVVICESYHFQDLRSSVIIHARDTKLSLKVGFDRSDRGSERNNGHPVKTGTHTYASWKSPDQREDTYESRENVNYNEEYGDDDSDSPGNDEEDDEVDNDVEVDPPSPILTWLRKLYDSMFFYGLDPAPASQRSNRRKMMQDAENYDSKKNSSPFFTPSEQRVQRYMTSMRNKSKEDSRGTKSAATPRVQQTEASRRSSTSRTENRLLPEDFKNQNQIISKANQSQGPRGTKSSSMEVVIDNLNVRIQDLTEELELVEAEIVTSGTSPGDREYPYLLRKRDSILDYIEDLEVELVTAKSRLL